ncbi:MAG: NAD(P)-dependent oxidoreductase [Polyangiaceae bacterium]|nr:NAD(P)-dependent oxidoreductase [Polyangiaceae bacterium]
MTTLAFLGTGLIGAGLVEAACRRGDTVTVYNRTPSKASALESVGARAVTTAAEAVRGAERVHLALSDDAAVDAVLSSVMDHLGSAIVVDHTTASPSGTAERAERLEGRGIGFVHAPVFMSPGMCRDAKGIMLAAGLASTFARVKDGLAVMTGTLDYLGERRDAAAAYKLFGNAMIFAITAGLADVYAMARALDIPAADALGLFSKFNPAAGLTYRGKLMAAGDYRPSFELTMAQKDARLMLEVGERGAVPLRVLPAIHAWMGDAIARGHGSDDLGALAAEAVPPER